MTTDEFISNSRSNTGSVRAWHGFGEGDVSGAGSSAGWGSGRGDGSGRGRSDGSGCGRGCGADHGRGWGSGDSDYYGRVSVRNGNYLRVRR